MSGRATHEAYLAGLGREPGSGLDLAEAALTLAALDRPRVPLARYRDHLDELRREAAAAVAGRDTVAAAAQALAELLAVRHRYRGDGLTYDDMQNANLMRVIDRRRGLPVTLGILYLHAARGAGLEAAGLSFPAHFVIRIARAGERAILDPFGAGRLLSAADLREILKRLAGPDRELDAGDLEPVGDRDILLRLLNNIRTRAAGAERFERAAEIGERMLLLAPEQPLLQREQALTAARLGKLKRARAAAEAYLSLAQGPTQAHDAALLLQRLKAELN